MIPRRLVIERIGWLVHHRRLARDYETTPHRSEVTVRVAMIDLISRRLTRESTPNWRHPNLEPNNLTGTKRSLRGNLEMVCAGKWLSEPPGLGCLRHTCTLMSTELGTWPPVYSGSRTRIPSALKIRQKRPALADHHCPPHP